MDPELQRLSLLGRPLPRAFTRRVVVIGPSEAMPIVEADWRDALVVVERGEIEVECSAGGRRCFSSGSVLWFEGLGLRTVHNTGSEPVTLAAVSRRGDPTA